jgi:hypothetical protein
MRTFGLSLQTGITAAAVAGLVVAFSAVVACGSSTSVGKDAKATGSKDQGKWPTDDKSMCEWRDKPELEVSETTGPGAIRPNVRRVYRDVGEGENRHKVLVCREIDSNLDGIKDVVRTFNAKGEALKENADTNFDGKLDSWGTFVNGRLSEEDIDTNFDGAADVWKYYVDGHLSRVKRDRNFDGKPDVWEIYTNGRLERMGIDDTFDGHVDRWDRDEAARNNDDQQNVDAGPPGPATATSMSPIDAADAGTPETPATKSTKTKAK